MNVMSARQCPDCHIDWYDSQGQGVHMHMHMVGYGYPHPEHYDGISEVVCEACGTRFGRWTQKVIPEGYCEPRFGRGGKPIKL